MVKEKKVIWFMCPYCNNRYRDESDAEDCRDNCLDVESIEEEEEFMYECGICGKEFEAEGKRQEIINLVRHKYIAGVLNGTKRS